jgi:hypothetical protein
MLAAGSIRKLKKETLLPRDSCFKSKKGLDFPLWSIGEEGPVAKASPNLRVVAFRTVAYGIGWITRGGPWD